MKLHKTNLAEQAYAALRDMLLGGERFAPGDKISVEDLARQLGVSRSPVWQAIARLEADGIVEVRPRQGVFFVGFDLDGLLEIMETREVLEGAAARLAAERASPGQVAELRASVERQRAALSGGAMDDYAAEAARFHSLMAQAAGNKVMVKIVERLWARAKAMCIRPGARPALLDERVDEHARMVEAIAHRDPDAAEAEIRAHIRRIARGIEA
ncbi:Transcriptional regulator(Transcription regulator HTH, GntR,8-70;GntR, C-terminal,81-205) [Magnetospirillum sp. XM-1]|uniref:GntR family transcriptional regulator n=1 Tax=Magnetospirillum sp. XM-1 TaxID=1663591 RepID=UPI00073DD141|nr:GntR family transcriptional regulator [Magnetospirillum sp. XM-1]CUW38254.1 Transcriptional regulator(Transcription regulator HTH, GntR,8-70;GntR, C-terminal,81-205) [Magnetospirillum sp. XM-1]